MEEGNLPSARPSRHVARDRSASLEGEHDSVVYAALLDAGDAGLTLVELEERTGLRNRVLQNVTWRLEVKQNRGCTGFRVLGRIGIDLAVKIPDEPGHVLTSAPSQCASGKDINQDCRVVR